MIDYTELIDLTDYEHINIEGIDIFFKLNDDIHTAEFKRILYKGIKSFRRFINHQNKNPEKYFFMC